MKKIIRCCSILLLGIAVLSLAFAAYTIFDNQRIVIVSQTVEIDGLDPAFDGFTILQVSDLHGARFGAKQERLASLVNSLDYDLLALTGDFQSRKRDTQPLYELLDAVQTDAPVVYIGGNAGPFDVDIFTGSVSPEGKKLQDAGCTLLARPFSIQRGDARLWFSETYLGKTPASLIAYARARLASANPNDFMQGYFTRQIEFQEELEKTFSGITPQDTLIGITHYPLPQATLDGDGNKTLPFDLVIAGHYHGGQIRLPFIGALYIPDSSSKLHGLFPNQRIVSGLYPGKSIQQYVSRGLGSSDVIPFLKFRLFNTPEINLITLRPKQTENE
jgi:predicted MPP superfamily phosphohydrolase